MLKMIRIVGKGKKDPSAWIVGKGERDPSAWNKWVPLVSRT